MTWIRLDPADVDTSLDQLDEVAATLTRRLEVVQAARAALQPFASTPFRVGEQSPRLISAHVQLSSEHAELLTEIGGALEQQVLSEQPAAKTVTPAVELVETDGEPPASKPVPDTDPEPAAVLPVEQATSRTAPGIPTDHRGRVSWRELADRLIQAGGDEPVLALTASSASAAQQAVGKVRRGEFKGGRRNELDAFAAGRGVWVKRNPHFAVPEQAESTVPAPPTSADTVELPGPPSGDLGLLCAHCRHPRRIHGDVGLCRRAGCYCSDFQEPV